MTIQTQAFIMDYLKYYNNVLTCPPLPTLYLIVRGTFQSQDC